MASSSLSLRSTGIARDSTASSATSAARANPSETTVGCMPRSSSLRHAVKRAPQMTVTEVVPSPAAASCERASSTSIFAAGCVTVIRLRIVAPSLVMTTSPLGWQTWGKRLGSFGVGFRFFFEVFEKKKKRRSEGEADRLPLVLRSLARSIPLSISSYHLVHPARAQARANGVGHGLGGLDVGDADVGLADVVPVEETEEREESDDGG